MMTQTNLLINKISISSLSCILLRDKDTIIRVPQAGAANAWFGLAMMIGHSGTLSFLGTLLLQTYVLLLPKPL
jgi:hypothetical protein